MRNITDPWTSEESVYECYECGHRLRTEGHQGSCPKCEGRMKNIAVPRE